MFTDFFKLKNLDDEADLSCDIGLITIQSKKKMNVLVQTLARGLGNQLDR